MKSDSSVHNMISCRLCNGQALSVFSLKVLHKHIVQYYKCDECLSLQTEAPYWLDEAYKFNIANSDTGVAQRTIYNFVFCYAFAQIFPIKTIIDFGGSDGLLCRFLRDYRIDCFTYDKFAKPTYAQEFANPTFDEPDLLTTFEVFEHLPNPMTELEEIFSFNPKFILCSTALYSNESIDWRYLAPESGQHIFFYSVTAINLIANRFGYDLTQLGPMILFLRKDLPDQSANIIAAQRILTGWIFEAIKSYIFLLPKPGIEFDQNLVISKPTPSPL